MGLLAAAGAAGAHLPAPGADPASLLVGTRVRPFSLRDHEGRAVRVRGVAGTASLVSFFYTRCGDTCPLLIDQLRRLRAELPGRDRDRLRVLLITIDPQYDTPPVLSAFAAHLAIHGGGWRFLTGAPADVIAVGKQFHVSFRTASAGVLAHTDAVYLLDGRLEIRAVYRADALSRSTMLHDVSHLLGTPP